MSELQWVDASEGAIPENAVEGGNEGDTTLYVGRNSVFGDTVPGKVIEGVGCLVSYGCAQHQNNEYQVLVNEAGLGLEWVSGSGGEVPENAVPGGETADGEVLYIGRGTMEDHLICGKVHPSHNCLYIAYDEGEHSINEYEVLVCPPSDE